MARRAAKAAPQPKSAPAPEPQTTDAIVVTQDIIDRALLVQAFLHASDHYFSAHAANAHDPNLTQMLEPVFSRMHDAWAAARASGAWTPKV